MNLHEYQHIIEHPSFYDGESAHPIHKMLKIPIYIVKIAHLLGTREQKDLAKKNQKHLIHFDEKTKKMFTILQIMAHNYMHKMNYQRSFSLQKYELSPNLLLPFSFPNKEVDFIDNAVPFMSESMILAEKIINEGKKKKKKPKKKGAQKKNMEQLQNYEEDDEEEVTPEQFQEEEQEFTRIEIEEPSESDSFLFENENRPRIEFSPIGEVSEESIESNDPPTFVDQPNLSYEMNNSEEIHLEAKGENEEENQDEIDQTDEVSSKGSSVSQPPAAPSSSNLYYEFTSKLKFISLSTKKVQNILEKSNLSYVDQLVSICEEYENLLLDMRENYDSIIQTTNLKLYIKDTQLEKLQEQLSNYETIIPLSKELEESEYDLANADDSLNYSFQYENRGEAEDSFIVHKGEENFFR